MKQAFALFDVYCVLSIILNINGSWKMTLKKIVPIIRIYVLSELALTRAIEYLHFKYY